MRLQAPSRMMLNNTAAVNNESELLSSVKLAANKYRQLLKVLLPHYQVKLWLVATIV